MSCWYGPSCGGGAGEEGGGGLGLPYEQGVGWAGAGLRWSCLGLLLGVRWGVFEEGDAGLDGLRCPEAAVWDRSGCRTMVVHSGLASWGLGAGVDLEAHPSKGTMGVWRVTDLCLLLAAGHEVAQKQQQCSGHLQTEQLLMWRSVGMWGFGPLLAAPEASPTWTPWKKRRSDGCNTAAVEFGAAAQQL